jgi:hypothetical protein
MSHGITAVVYWVATMALRVCGIFLLMMMAAVSVRAESSPE